MKLSKRERRQALRIVEKVLMRPESATIADMAKVMNILGTAYSEKLNQSVIVVPVIDCEHNQKLTTNFKNKEQQ